MYKRERVREKVESLKQERNVQTQFSFFRNEKKLICFEINGIIEKNKY